jgi:hypothetical protein
MIYFKKVELLQYSYDQIEHGLRKVSAKRTSSLDMISPVSDIGSDKYFLGRENEGVLTFTRIRTSFERALPRAIIKLTPGHSYYEVRFSLLSSIVFLFVGVLTSLSLIIGVMNGGNIEGILALGIVCILYALLIMLELKLVKSKVARAVAQYTASSIAF